jgi:hypothetical protein
MSLPHRLQRTCVRAYLGASRTAAYAPSGGTKKPARARLHARSPEGNSPGEAVRRRVAALPAAFQRRPTSRGTRLRSANPNQA